jgi:hypothetical protein
MLTIVLVKYQVVQFIVSIILSIIVIWAIKRAFFTKRGASAGAGTSSSVGGGVGEVATA